MRRHIHRLLYLFGLRPVRLLLELFACNKCNLLDSRVLNSFRWRPASVQQVGQGKSFGPIADTGHLLVPADERSLGAAVQQWHSVEH